MHEQEKLQDHLRLYRWHGDTTCHIHISLFYVSALEFPSANKFVIGIDLLSVSSGFWTCCRLSPCERMSLLVEKVLLQLPRYHRTVLNGYWFWIFLETWKPKPSCTSIIYYFLIIIFISPFNYNNYYLPVYMNISIGFVIAFMKSIPLFWLFKANISILREQPGIIRPGACKSTLHNFPGVLELVIADFLACNRWLLVFSSSSSSCRCSN